MSINNNYSRSPSGSPSELGHWLTSEALQEIYPPSGDEESPPNSSNEQIFPEDIFPYWKDLPHTYLELYYKDTSPETAKTILAQDPIDPVIRDSIFADIKLFIARYQLNPIPEWISSNYPQARSLHLLFHPEQLWDELHKESYDWGLVTDLVQDNCRDFLGLNVLHYACRWEDDRKFQLIAKLIVLCPALVHLLDSELHFPFDKLAPTDSDKLIGILETTPYPGVLGYSKGNAYRWLSLLCRLKKSEFALAYVTKMPYALLPIEFDQLENIKTEGRFIPYRIEDLPLSVLGNECRDSRMIKIFLEIWEQAMQDATGIGVGFFGLYIEGTHSPFSNYPQSQTIKDLITPLWDSFDLNLDALFKTILQSNEHHQTYYGINPLHNIIKCKATEEQKTKFLEFLLLIKNKLEMSRKNPSALQTITFYYIYNHLEYSNKLIPIEVFGKRSNWDVLKLSIDKLLTSSSSIKFQRILSKLLVNLSNRSIPIGSRNHMNPPGLSANLVKKALGYCENPPKLLNILSCFPLIIDQNQSESIRASCEIALALNIPIVTSINENTTLKHVSDDFDALGYFIFNLDDRIIHFPEGALATKSIFPPGETVVVSRHNIHFQINICSEYGVMEIATAPLNENDAVPNISLKGYFTPQSFDAFIVNLATQIQETFVEDDSFDWRLSHLSLEPPTIDELELFLDRALPIRLVKNSQLKKLTCYYYCFSEKKILSYQIEAQHLWNFTLDVKKHLEIALSKYKFIYGYYLEKIERNMHSISHLFPEVVFDSRLGVLANTLHEKLLLTLEELPNTSVIVGDSSTDRYLYGWCDGGRVNVSILPTNFDERLETLTLLEEMRTLSYQHEINSENLSKFVSVNKGKIHSEPAAVSKEEILATLENVCKTSDFIKYASEWNLTIRQIQQGFPLILEKILLKRGFNDLNPEVDADIYQSIFIQFTHSYHHYKNQNPEGLPAFFIDIGKHWRLCITGVRKEIWQHYYICYPESLALTHNGYFEDCVTGTLAILIDQLQGLAIHHKAFEQSVHLRNYLYNQLSKKIRVPKDVFMLLGQAPEKDPYSVNNHYIGDDYNEKTLELLATQTLFPSLMLQLIGKWKSIKISNSREYPELLNEFLSLFKENTPIEKSVEVNISKIEQLREVISKKQNEITALQSTHLWQSYKSAAAEYPNIAENFKKRQNVAVSQGSAKKQKTTSPSITDKLILKKCLSEMKEAYPISRILELQSDIDNDESTITALLKHNYGTIKECISESLSNRDELTKLHDDWDETRDLTLKGAFNWLKLKDVLIEQQPSAASSSSSSHLFLNQSSSASDSEDEDDSQSNLSNLINDWINEYSSRNQEL